VQFEEQIAVAAPREKVWNFIWDVDRFIACVPGCKEAKTLENAKIYTATMVEKVGPFRVEFPMRIEVEQSEPLSHIKARATGSDSKIGSLMKIDLDVNLKEEGNGTLLSLVVTVDILGKLATLGHSIMKRKANQVMAEFVQELKKHLEGES
jgi:carbon monoxide dehydrogenase subunit G